MIIEGIVISLIARYYDVMAPNGLVRTRARGVFRKRQEKPQVGDLVKVQLDKRGTNYLIEVFKRKNRIGRPAVSNVSYVLLVVSAVEPDSSVNLLDRFLIFFAWQGTPVVVYLPKADLATDEQVETIREALNYYEKVGYRVFSNKKKIEQALLSLIKGNEIWTLAGQSGAGKSISLNFLREDAGQDTGEISKSLDHGKHTTRSAQLFTYSDGFIANTPGFSAIDLGPIRIKELQNYFIEFNKASQFCKFRGCQHIHEPKCEVKALLSEGKITQFRYDDYLTLRTEIEDQRLPEYLK